MSMMTKNPKGDHNEDAIDAAIAKKAMARNEETLSEVEMDELLATTTPRAFWRKKRGLAKRNKAKPQK
jgi:hypothetical protein